MADWLGIFKDHCRFGSEDPGLPDIARLDSAEGCTGFLDRADETVDVHRVSHWVDRVLQSRRQTGERDWSQPALEHGELGANPEALADSCYAYQPALTLDGSCVDVVGDEDVQLTPR